MTSAKSLYPTDPSWKITTPYTQIGLYAATATSRETFVLSLSLEGPENALFEPYSRLVRYDHGVWSMTEIDSCIVSMAPCLGIPGSVVWPTYGLAALSYDSFVFYLGDHGRVEPITGTQADPVIDDDKHFNAQTRIRFFHEDLWVCGEQGQLYRRSPMGWHIIDDGLREKIDITEDDIINNSMKKLTINDFNIDKNYNYYACGSKPLFQGALYYKGKESQWERISISDSTGALTALCKDNEGNIWVCGSENTILKGNKEYGFSQIKYKEFDGTSFTSIEFYKNKIYLGSTKGIYCYDGNKIDSISISGASKLNFGKIDMNFFQVIDGMLFVFGHHGHVYRFDGTTWEKITIPALGGEQGHH